MITSTTSGAGYQARVFIQSRECSPGVLERLTGSVYFPERRLGATIVSSVCRDGMSLLYVAAPEVADAAEQIEYFLGLLPAASRGQEASRRNRVRLISLDDSSARWLSTKVLDTERQESAQARKRIRDFVHKERQAGAEIKLSYYEPSEKLERFAAELGIVGDQVSSQFIGLGTKGSSRHLFAAAGIPMPAGTAEFRGLRELAGGVAGLVRQGHYRQVVKLCSTEYGGGFGNALLDVSELRLRDVRDSELTETVLALLPARTTLADAKIGWGQFADWIGQSGVLSEELIEGDEVRSPSYQGEIDADGRVTTTSTHEQVLGDLGQIFTGCKFPAGAEYRRSVIRYGLAAGHRLAELGVRGGDYGVDFIAVRRGERWDVFGCEVNLRTTATKHGFAMTTGLLGVLPDESGRLFTGGSERVYQSSDAIADSRYQGLRPRDLIATVSASPLGYDHNRKTGVVLHMMSAAVEYGKFGAVAIGTDSEHAEALIEGLRVLIDDLAGAREDDVA
ncbi:MAG TPA: peptide ligase PGM1-related protein [Streptosporangiaceae bacterium]|nr:peptide ligase PGM1-related protein [Streptosporangiaceae bacterium]